MSKKFSLLVWLLIIVLSILQRAGVIGMAPGLSWAAIAGIVGCCIWYYWNLGPTHRYQEYLYQPLDPDDLPPETREWFDQHTPEFQDLGFEWLEDTRLLETPYRHDVRVFQSPDGNVLGTTEWVNNLQAISCMSVFEDGMSLETTSLPQGSGPMPEPQDLMCWAHAPHESPEGVFRRHLEGLHRYQTETGAEVITLGLDNYSECMTYGHRLVWHWRRRRGLIRDEVPKAVLPQRLRHAVVS